MGKRDTVPPNSVMAARGAPNSQGRRRSERQFQFSHVESQAQVLLHTDEPGREHRDIDTTDWGDFEGYCIDLKNEPDVDEYYQFQTNPPPEPELNDSVDSVESNMEDDVEALSYCLEQNVILNQPSTEYSEHGKHMELLKDDLTNTGNNTAPGLTAIICKNVLKIRLSNNQPEKIKKEKIEKVPEVGEKEEKKEEVKREDPEVFNAKFNKGSHLITPSFTLFPTIEEITRTELGNIILTGDVKGYFDYMTQHLKPKRNGKLCDDCLCADAYLLSRKFHYHLTPLHMAVSTKNKDFLFSIIDMETIRDEFTERIKDREQFELISGHYRDLVTTWLTFRKKKVRTSAFELAAELGEIENIKTILNSKLGDYALEKMKATDYERYSTEECWIHQHLKDQSVLSGLLESETFYLLDSSSRDKLMKKLRRTQVDNAICAALEKGKLDLVEGIVAVHNEFCDKGEEYLSEDWVAQTNFVRNGPHPPSHLLAYNGLYEEFRSLREEVRMALDRHGGSALPLLLGFNDDQVLEQIKLFRGVRREDHFLFVKEIVVAKRRTLLVPALQMALSNRDNFNPQNNYLPYGLPGSLTLPLETAILRAADMTAVDEITKAYSRQGEFSEKMCEEDCFRCLKGIQDSATNMTDQSRLALILILLPFVDVFSKRFKKLICMYATKSTLSDVGNFVYSQYAAMRSRVYKPRLTYVSCEQAMEDASVAVSGWNGDLEYNSTVPKLDSRAKRIKKEPPDEPRGILITEQKKAVRQQRRREEEETLDDAEMVAPDCLELEEELSELWKHY